MKEIPRGAHGSSQHRLESYTDVDLGSVVPATLNAAAGIKVQMMPSTVLHFDQNFDNSCQQWLTAASEVDVQQLAKALGFTAYSYDDLSMLKEWVGGKLAQFCTVGQGYCRDHGATSESWQVDAWPPSQLPRHPAKLRSVGVFARLLAQAKSKKAAEGV